MRLAFAIILAMSLVGCNVESSTSSETTSTNSDGSTTTTKTSTRTKNGVMTGTKTETTLSRDGKLSVVTYEKKGNDWVKQNP
jgi:hypothetical protein